MGVTAYSDLRDKARLEAGDLAGIRWTDAELDRYIEAGQREYALLRLELQGSFRVESLGESIFTAPSNYIQPVRFTDATGCDLPFYSFRQLSDDYTPKFLTDNIGSPIMACFNFDNWNQFRFYPALASGTAGTLFYNRYPDNEMLEVNEDALLYYVWWRMYLREWDAEYLRKSIHYRKLFKTELHRGNRGNSVSVPYTATLPTFNDVRTALRELLQDTGGEIWDNARLDNYLNEAQAQYVKRSGCLKRTVEMVPDTAGTFCFPSDFIDFSYAWNADGFEMKTILEKKMRSAYGAACDTETGIPELIYDGLSSREYKLFPKPGDVSIRSTFDSEPGEIAQIDGIISEQEMGGIVCINVSSIDNDIATFPELADSGFCYKITAEDESYFYEAFAAIGTFISQPFWCVRRINTSSGNIDWAQDTNACIFPATNLPSVFAENYVITNNAENNDIENFNCFADGEAGGCNAILEYTGATGMLHYVRAPYKNMIEIRNPDALLWYAGAKCFEEDREHKDLNKALALRQAFADCLNIENAINSSQTGHKKTGRFM